MSQCHDPYDSIEGPTANDRAATTAAHAAPKAAQCHDSYDSIAFTNETPSAAPAKAAVLATNGARARGRIVVGVDGSEASREALRWAARQAHLMGASLEAVMSWETAATTSYPVPVPEGYDPAADAKEALDQTVRSVLGQHDGLELVPAVLQGPAARTLVQEARGADLLVVGSRGHGALVGMLLGSVSEQCVTHAPCPVVVVHKNHHAA